MRLFIAEKPALAKIIAEALGGAVRQEGYIKCGNDVVTWCVGHILELVPPEVINPAYKEWRFEDLPMNFRPATYRPVERTAAQFAVVSSLIKQASEVVHAGDPDDEGQLLVDEVLDYCNNTAPVKRVLINDLNVSAAKKSLSNLRDNSEFRGLSEKARARSLGDWYYGMNMTRAYTLAAKEKNPKMNVLLSVGRVQTPILGLIVRRYLAFKDHKGNFFWRIGGGFSFEGSTISASLTVPDDAPADDKGRVIDGAYAENIKGACEGKSTTVIEHSIDNKKASAPLPFSLLDLQVAMSSRYGLSAQSTLDITQSLRDKHRAITYNRSDCNYLSSDQFLDAPDTINAVCKSVKDFGSFLPKLDSNKKGRAFNDANVSAHTAIIPAAVSVTFENMDENEQKVYKAIAERYLSQFMPEKEYDTVQVTFDSDGKIFKSKANNVTTLGWSELVQGMESDIEDEGDNGESEEDSSFSTLSKLKVGDIGSCREIKISKEKTKPLPLYTEAALLKDLQRVSKYVKDEKIKALLKERDANIKGESGGIGTPATRASMLQTLEKRGFYVVDKKRFVPTDLGIAFYKCLPAIATQPDMTALWHEQQKTIESGEFTVDQFLDELEVFVKYQVNNISLGDLPVPESEGQGRNDRLEAVCPGCKNEIVVTPSQYACTGCDFKVRKTILGKVITVSQANKLIGKGKTAVIKGFTSNKTSKTFDAALSIDATGKISFHFPPNKK
jgi:DNA topoisomerase-3